ncbi:iron chelate uptake ABC transporter family permease subunit [Ammoniphilus sp. 3BR4]
MHSFRDWSHIGYVSQKANSFNTGFPATVFEVVSTGLFGKMGLFKWIGRQEKEFIYHAIEMVGLGDFAKRNIGKLSGGQQQRTFINHPIRRIVFISLANGFNVNLYGYLFGSIVAITRSDMYTVLVTAIFVLTVILLFYKELFSLSFDEENAKISGIPSKRVNLIFTVLLALVIASSMRIVGILLVSSLIILPVAASMKIANSFKQTFFYSILFAQSSVVSGLYVSYLWDLTPGGTIVIIALLILCTVIGYKNWRQKQE